MGNAGFISSTVGLCRLKVNPPKVGKPDEGQIVLRLPIHCSSGIEAIGFLTFGLLLEFGVEFPLQTPPEIPMTTHRP